MIPRNVPFELDESLKPNQFKGYDLNNNLCLEGDAGERWKFYSGCNPVAKVSVGRGIWDELKHLETMQKSRAALSQIDSLLDKK